MCSATGCDGFAITGFPIRTSPDRRLYTAPRGFSQCPTSFIGTWRLGIHRKLLVASLRDAEKSKLFASCYLSFLRLLPYSFGKVLRHQPPPTVARSVLRPPQSAAQLSLQPRLSTNEPGSPAGSSSRQSAFPSMNFTMRIISNFFPSVLSKDLAPSGDEGTRTPDIRLAKAALSQLSYIPEREQGHLLYGPEWIRTTDPCVISTVL